MSLAHTPAGLQVQVRDHGTRFDPTAERVSRHGLAGMRYRVEALGGTMELQSAPGDRAPIAAVLPALPAIPAVPAVPL